MTFFNTAFLLALILFLSGCPSIMKIDLRNDSSEPIAVVYETEYESEIAPGEVKREHYTLSCLKIKQGEVLHEYQPSIPPERYFAPGIFDSSLSATFTSDHRLIIFQKSAPNDSFELDRGCITQSSAE